MNFKFVFAIITSLVLVLMTYQTEVENQIIPSIFLGLLAIVGLKALLDLELGK
jgi:hypothetical protein